MALIENLLIYASTKESFEDRLQAGDIQSTSIAYIADTQEIWTHGVYYGTSLTAEEVETIITSSQTIEEFITQVSPAEVVISETEPTNNEKIWIDTSDSTASFSSSALPAAVAELTSSSTSEEIATAFDGLSGFNLLLAQVRSLNSISHITVNNDEYAGRIPISLLVSKTENRMIITFPYDGSLVTLTVTYDGSAFSCERTTA